MLENKAKLAQKQYEIIILGIFITKIKLEKAKEMKKKIVMQNTRICISIKIENIFWFFILKKDKHTSLLIIEVDNAKMANILIEKKPVLNYTLHEYMRYNLTCKIKQYFNCYKYGHILVYC